MTTRIARLVLIVIVLSVAGCDQGTKRWAEGELRDGPVEVVGRNVELRLAHNPGIAFNAERAVPATARRWIVVAGALALLGLATMVLARRPAWSARSAGIALAIGGGLGNLIDRIARDGEVVDFVHVRGWPIFNVADVAIAVGLGLLVISRARPRPAEPR